MMKKVDDILCSKALGDVLDVFFPVFCVAVLAWALGFCQGFCSVP